MIEWMNTGDVQDQKIDQSFSYKYRNASNKRPPFLGDFSINAPLE